MSGTAGLACVAAARTELRGPLLTIAIRPMAAEGIDCVGYPRSRYASTISSNLPCSLSLRRQLNVCNMQTLPLNTKSARPHHASLNR